ncbi:hypothetical protein RB195_000039 [Necator americanus]|uniref:Uncharacterized protein n=1 Tax=Necator americanus TaxID=51031 RepID=A0ABR1D7N2_NECAM
MQCGTKPRRPCLLDDGKKVLCGRTTRCLMESLVTQMLNKISLGRMSKIIINIEDHQWDFEKKRCPEAVHHEFLRLSKFEWFKLFTKIGFTQNLRGTIRNNGSEGLECPKTLRKRERESRKRNVMQLWKIW